MNRVYLVLLCIALFILAGCSGRQNNVTFKAVVESVSEHGMMVVTSDNVGFDKASVGYTEALKLDFEPAAGQTVEITILPKIRESYPVQVTAVRIALIQTGGAPSIKAEYRKISAEEAKAMMDAGNVTVLDVRTASEYAEGHIKNAILLPDTDINSKAHAVLPDKQAKILVYCRSGRRSELAARALVQMGYINVYDFGGIIDWPYETVK